MIAALKWTTIAWLGVMAASAACFAMFTYQVMQPAAWILGSILLPIVLPPLFVVFMVTPGTAPEWQLVAVGAVALYLWLFGLVVLGYIIKAWNEERFKPAGSL